MKRVIKYLILISIASAICIGCNKDDENFKNNNTGNVDAIDSVGYLSLSGLNVNVDTNSGDEIITKATSEALDSYKVIITNTKDDEIVYNKTYGEIKSLSEPLALTPGLYHVDVKSIDVIPAAEWSMPQYAGAKDVTITKNMTTEVKDLVCTLSNIKTSVGLSADLKALFKDDEDGSEDNLRVVVSLGNNSFTYNRDETRCGFFAAANETNTIKIELSGMYNTAPEGATPIYEKIENWTQTLTNVKAGEWRKIYIRIENSHDGNVNFIVTVQKWVYGEEIDVDIMSSQYSFEEEEIYDPDSEVTEPNSPVISLVNGHNIEDTFLISTSIFDFDSESCSDIIKGKVTPVAEATIESIEVDFESDNDLLISDLESAGYSDYKVGLFPTNSFADYLTIKEESGSNTLAFTFKYTGMIKLYNYVGTHTIRIMAKDSEGRRSYTFFNIKVDKVIVPTSGPSIVWDGGYSFDNRYEVSLTSKLPVVINITSETGITGFIINIDSDKLTKEELVGMKLDSEMNLLDPATDDMVDALKGLGFPVGSDVSGKKAVTFDITSFMPALAVLGTGNSDFKLTVTDASGTNVQTLKVLVK